MADFSPTFYIGTIHIESIEGASCLNMGNNLPVGFRSYKKENQGFGSISGNNNTISGLRSLLKDSNVIDILDQSEEEDIPEWVRKLIEEKFENNEELLENLEGV